MLCLIYCETGCLRLLIQHISLKDYDIRTNVTSTATSSHLLPIGKNMEIPKANRFSEKHLIITGNLVDNMIHRIINHNLLLTTTVNSIVMI